MNYGSVRCGRFLKRLNRFAAAVLLDGEEIQCHVRNSGRLGELLRRDVKAYVAHQPAIHRKTAWTLLSVECDGQIINIDSQAPNAVFREWVEGGGFRGDVQAVRAEYTYGDSRFDFRIDCTHTVQLVETKGVTLLRDGVACFPDAPTLRGVKHLKGLMRAVDCGLEAAVVFIIQCKGVTAFSPNDDTQPDFGRTLRCAAGHGVEVYAFDCRVAEDEIALDMPVAIKW